MAKAQGLALNPTTISGMCGRLKCCLKYEFDTYKELEGNLPRTGAAVRCAEGCGCVWDKDIMKQRVKVKLDDGRMVECPVEDLDQVSGKTNGEGS